MFPVGYVWVVSPKEIGWLFLPTAPNLPNKGNMAGELPWPLFPRARLKSKEKQGQKYPWKPGHTSRACAAPSLSSVYSVACTVIRTHWTLSCTSEMSFQHHTQSGTTASPQHHVLQKHPGGMGVRKGGNRRWDPQFQCWQSSMLEWAGPDSARLIWCHSFSGQNHMPAMLLVV